MSGYRPEFEEALRLFGRASEAMKARGLPAGARGGAVIAAEEEARDGRDARARGGRMKCGCGSRRR